MLRKLALTTAILLGLTLAAHAAFGIFQTRSGLSNAWAPMKIGAGGWLRGLNIACDAGYGNCAGSGTSTQVTKTDTYGAYIWCANCPSPGNAGGSGTWVQLVTTATMPVGNVMNAPNACLENSPYNTCGVFEIRIAPSDTNIAYMSMGGYIYKTTNLRSCASTSPSCSWAATGFSQDTSQNAQSHATGGSAEYGPRIAIDYADPSRIIVCGAACKYSTNGGTSFTTVSGATASSTGSMVIADPSTTSGGATSGWYVCSYGNGCYRSTTGPNGTFSLTSSGPTTISYMAITSGGKLYVTPSDGTHQLWSFTGSWTNVTISSTGSSGQLQNVAIDPANANNVVVQNIAGQLAYSTNAATSFGNYVTTGNMSRTATDIPWLGFTKEVFMSAGQIEYDPAQSNKLLFSEGIGLWTTSPSTGSTITWTSQSAGIEQLVANWVVSPPGSFGPTNTGVNVATWDRPQFYIGNPNTYPSTHGAANATANSIVFGWSIDYASANPTTIFADAEDGAVSTSSNGGLTGGSSNWTQCSTLPSGVPSTYAGGTVLASSSSVFVWVLSNDGPLNVSTDGCATWSVPTITGVATSGARGWDQNHFVMRHPACADRVATNTFYAYNAALNSSTSTAGIYKGVWNGSTWTWTRALTGHIDANDGDPVQLVCSPTTAGKMFYTSGSVFGTHPVNQSFYKCTDSAGTVTCNAVANVKEVWAVGLGKPAPGQTEAAIYIAGYVSNVWGFWRSIDDGASWTNLGVPLNSLDTIKTITGDANTYGYVYVGFSGSGYSYGQFN